MHCGSQSLGRQVRQRRPDLPVTPSRLRMISGIESEHLLPDFFGNPQQAARVGILSIETEVRPRLPRDVRRILMLRGLLCPAASRRLANAADFITRARSSCARRATRLG